LLPPALSDLLEIRHQLNALDVTLDEMSKILPMTPELEVTLRGALQQFSLPDASKLSHRYDESVSLVSAVDPILGSELRSKDLVGPGLLRLP
jgi:hypothetical protein